MAIGPGGTMEPIATDETDAGGGAGVDERGAGEGIVAGAGMRAGFAAFSRWALIEQYTLSQSIFLTISPSILGISITLPFDFA